MQTSLMQIVYLFAGLSTATQYVPRGDRLSRLYRNPRPTEYHQRIFEMFTRLSDGKGRAKLFTRL